MPGLSISALLGAGATTSGQPATPADDPANIVEVDIAGRPPATRRNYQRQAREAYLRRIAALDDGGPRPNAVIEINPNLVSATRDSGRKAGHVRGPLHGIPVLLNDNIDPTLMVNSAGSLALAEHRPKADAPGSRAARRPCGDPRHARPLKPTRPYARPRPRPRPRQPATGNRQPATGRHFRRPPVHASLRASPLRKAAPHA